MADSTFFTNRECEYFPCHEGVGEQDFNCLLCFCPLYCKGCSCGGDFVYTSGGVRPVRFCSRRQPL